MLKRSQNRMALPYALLAQASTYHKAEVHIKSPIEAA